MKEIYIGALRGFLFIGIYFVPLYYICVLWFWLAYKEWIRFGLAKFLSFLCGFVWLGLTYRIWTEIIKHLI